MSAGRIATSHAARNRSRGFDISDEFDGDSVDAESRQIMREAAAKVVVEFNGSNAATVLRMLGLVSS